MTHSTNLPQNNIPKYAILPITQTPDPKQLICSFSQIIQNPTMQDIGLEHEYILYLDVLAKSKYKPIVLDSNDILSDPEGMLKALCKQLNISYTTKMLEWEAGPIDADGIWAKYWYKNVHQSTGFKKQQAKEKGPLIKKQ